MNTTKTKTTKGRQKIEIKKIEKVENRQVTFTKRRGGLFKKSAELCILTAADVAVIVKSPGGRTFAFGHPSVDAVVDRYLCGGKGSANLAVTEDLTRGFSFRHDDLAKELAEEKRRTEMIAESNVPNIGFWWQEPIERVRVEELESYVAALEELKKKVNKKADEMMFMRASNSTIPMLAMNNTSSENSSELAYHFSNQTHGSSSINSVVPFGYDFRHGHA